MSDFIQQRKQQLKDLLRHKRRERSHLSSPDIGDDQSVDEETKSEANAPSPLLAPANKRLKTNDMANDHDISTSKSISVPMTSSVVAAGSLPAGFFDNDDDDGGNAGVTTVTTTTSISTLPAAEVALEEDKKKGRKIRAKKSKGEVLDLDEELALFNEEIREAEEAVLPKLSATQQLELIEAEIARDDELREVSEQIERLERIRMLRRRTREIAERRSRLQEEERKQRNKRQETSENVSKEEESEEEFDAEDLTGWNVRTRHSRLTKR